jgi:hypothetical protein
LAACGTNSASSTTSNSSGQDSQQMSEDVSSQTSQKLDITAPKQSDIDINDQKIYMTWKIKNSTDLQIHDINVNFSSLDADDNILETPSWTTGESKVKPGQSIDRFTGFDTDAKAVELTSYSYTDNDGNEYDVDLSDNPIRVEIAK